MGLAVLSSVLHSLSSLLIFPLPFSAKHSRLPVACLLNHAVCELSPQAKKACGCVCVYGLCTHISEYPFHTLTLLPASICFGLLILTCMQVNITCYIQENNTVLVFPAELRQLYTLFHSSQVKMCPIISCRMRMLRWVLRGCQLLPFCHMWPFQM